jgi:DNA repair exonuclease SbcCD ATPase subunit
VNQQNVDKKTEEILEELNKIFDKLTSKDKTKPQVEEFLKKVDEFKQELKTVTEEKSFIEKIEQQEKTEQNTEEVKSVSSTTPEEIVVDKARPFSQQEVAKVEEKEEKKQINTMLLYPVAVPNSKDEFFTNINSTLARISKNKIELLPILCIEYEFFDKDLNYFEISEKIKQYNIFALFLITTRLEFIKTCPSLLTGEGGQA